MTAVDKKILVVDDDRETRISLFEALNRHGYQVSVAENGRMALEMLSRSPADLVITDVKMPEMDGLELFSRIRSMDPAVPVVLITGFASVDTAVEAMKKGAFDYILKPFPMEVIEQAATRALEAAALPSGVGGKPPAREGEAVKAIIGEEEAWRRVVERAEAVASSTATVLILGESGTGKEVVARYIHQRSDRRHGPFVALNCAALPDGLLESELFGHEKGAFTGAVSMKKGKFELAHGGTLLLDEIGEIPLHLQAKLLRVLQEEEVDRLGGKTPIKFDVHVIATTNRNLKEAVEKGEFRQDLFYRLNVIPLRLPPLRERRRDIFLLADHFIRRYSGRYGKPVKELSAAARERFLAYEWPGNVRELENMIERAVLLSGGDRLEPWDLWDGEDCAPPPAAAAAEAPSFVDGNGKMMPLREAERQMILQALRKTDNNRTHAAKMLGISVRTLRNKLHEYRNKGLM